MRLLIVGGLEGHITAASKIALARGAKVNQVDSVAGALAALRGGQGADLVMMDVKLDIARLILNLKSERINVPVVACGIGTDADTAVAAIKAGAKEYVPLPPDAELIAAVQEAVAEEASAVIFRDPVMKTTMKLADQIAPSDASVLNTGESGTGKEVVARYLHAKSKRGTQRFVSVNCAAIPENLLESELYTELLANPQRLENFILHLRCTCLGEGDTENAGWISTGEQQTHDAVGQNRCLARTRVSTHPNRKIGVCCLALLV